MQERKCCKIHQNEEERELLRAVRRSTTMCFVFIEPDPWN